MSISDAQLRFTKVVLAASLCCFAGLAGAQGAVAVTPPTDTPPLGLPFAFSEQARLTAGPHTNNDHNAGCTNDRPCNSLDFSPRSGHVTAAGPGVVQPVPDSCLRHTQDNGRVGLVFIRHTTNGHFNGWWTGYYHLLHIRVKTGDKVKEGTLLGNKGQAIPCGGSMGPLHVHFFVKWAPRSHVIGDPFQETGPDVGLGGLTIGGWKIRRTGIADGCMKYLPVFEEQCSPTGLVTNYGKECQPTSPVVRLNTTGIDCDTARQAVTLWDNFPGCQADGSRCHVTTVEGDDPDTAIEWACTVPQDGSNELHCTANRRLIIGQLE
jgi:hypothetical protein